MRKYLILFLLPFLLLGQVLNTRYVKAEVDSLQGVLPSISGTDKADVYIELSSRFYYKNYPLCVEYAIKAQMLSEELDYHLGLYQAFMIISNKYRERDRLRLALEYRQKAISVKEKYLKSENIHIDYLKAGQILRTLRRFDEARIYFDKALNFCNKTPEKSFKHSIYINQGINYRNMFEFEKSLAANDSALALAHQFNDSVSIYLINTNIGDVQEIMGNYSEARKYYLKSLKYYTDNMKNDGLYNIYFNLGNLEKSEGNFKEAINYFHKAKQIANETNNIYLKKIVLLGLYGVYNATGDFIQATKTYLKFQYYDNPNYIYNYNDEVQETRQKIKLEEAENQKKEYQKKVLVQRNRITIIISLFSGVILLVLFGYYLKRKSHRISSLKLQKEKTKAELLSLQSRINPHFLFNSLNSVAGLIKLKPDSAEDMVQNISELLRYTLQSAKKDFVTLEDELEICAKYLEIEKIRFGERLEYDLRIDSFCLKHLIPPLLLQPLVENSIKHGISRRRQGGKLRITCSGDNKNLYLEVWNNGGQNFKEDSISYTKGSGFGLMYLKNKLKLVYGREHQVEIEKEAGFQVKITIPNSID